MSIVDTIRLMPLSVFYDTAAQMQQVKDIQVLPACAADCKTPRYIWYHG